MTPTTTTKITIHNTTHTPLNISLFSPTSLLHTLQFVNDVAPSTSISFNLLPSTFRHRKTKYQIEARITTTSTTSSTTTPSATAPPKSAAILPTNPTYHPTLDFLPPLTSSIGTTLLTTSFTTITLLSTSLLTLFLLPLPSSFRPSKLPTSLIFTTCTAFLSTQILGLGTLLLGTAQEGRRIEGLMKGDVHVVRSQEFVVPFDGEEGGEKEREMEFHVSGGPRGVSIRTPEGGEVLVVIWEEMRRLEVKEGRGRGGVVRSGLRGVRELRG